MSDAPDLFREYFIIIIPQVEHDFCFNQLDGEQDSVSPSKADHIFRRFRLEFQGFPFHGCSWILWKNSPGALY